LTVRSFPSTDAGSAFVVQADGLTIYYAGDHALWAEGQRMDYEESLRQAKATAPRLDLAFLPSATGSAACTERESLRNGAVTAIRILQPTVTLPMHARCADRRTAVFTALAAAIKGAVPQTQVVVADAVGFRFEYSSAK